jgi:hypothetical protein
MSDSKHLSRKKSEKQIDGGAPGIFSRCRRGGGGAQVYSNPRQTKQRGSSQGNAVMGGIQTKLSTPLSLAGTAS